MSRVQWLREASVRLRELNPGLSIRDAVDLAVAIAEGGDWFSDPCIAVDTAFLRELSGDWSLVDHRPRPAFGGKHS